MKKTLKKTKEKSKTETKDPERFSAIPLSIKAVNDRNLNWIQLIGALLGLTGIATALLWLFGYHYANGLFASSDFFLIASNLNYEDYINLGSYSFSSLIINCVVVSIIFIASSKLAEHIHLRIYYFTKQRILKFIISIVSIILFFLGIDWLFKSEIFQVQGLYQPIDFFVFFILCLSGELEATQKENNEVPTFLLRAFFISIIALIIIQSHMFQSYRKGYEYGCVKLQSKETSVILYTDNTAISNNEKVEGYYLLFFDKYYYYLYKDTNPVSLKPLELTVIDKSKIAKIEVFENMQKADIKNIQNLCNKRALEDTKR